MIIVYTTGICLVISAIMAYYYIGYIHVDLAKIVIIVMISGGYRNTRMI